MWEPPAANGRIGEFEVRWDNGPPIFVEVKAPDWQGELSADEKTGPRKAEGKHIDMEGRRVDPLAQPLAVIARNAVPKLTADNPNLIVIADDLFLSPLSVPFWDDRIDEFLMRSENATIGGVLFFQAEQAPREIEYVIRFHETPAAFQKVRLPAGVVSGFTASSKADSNRKSRTYWL